MSKFKTCREILLLSYADNNISDEEFVPLYDFYRSKNPDFGYQSYDVSDLENIISADCKAEFRVEKADLPRLADALHIPAVFHCKQRNICDGLEGLCVLLRRTSYPCRFSDMIQRFPRPVSVLSLITNEVLDFIYDTHCHLVTEWNRDVLSSLALQQYAERIPSK